MNIKYASVDDTDSIKNIWKYCFNDEDSFMDYYFKNKYKNYNTVVLEEDEEIVSSLQLNPYKIKLNNKTYDTSYVVGVSTFPQARGLGHMKKIMEFSLNEMYKKNQLISILMPIDYRLYRKYGYEHCYDQIEYNLDINDLARFKIKGKMKRATKHNIDDLIKIDNIYLKNLNGNVCRDKNYYENLFKEIECENGYIYIHENQEFEGYIIYFINGENLFVREMFYKNIDSLKTMLKFIYNHNTQCKKATILTPINDKIKLILDNPKTCDIKIKPFMMGRIINLKGYLESLEIESDKNLRANIYIKDTYIKENNGAFNITLVNNKLKVEKVKCECDLEFDINTITQLAFSYIDLDEALFVSKAENIYYENKEMHEKNISEVAVSYIENVNNEKCIELLNAIFKKKNNYINEYV